VYFLLGLFGHYANMALKSALKRSRRNYRNAIAARKATLSGTLRYREPGQNKGRRMDIPAACQ
jgi:hypothetical protein